MTRPTRVKYLRVLVAANDAAVHNLLAFLHHQHFPYLQRLEIEVRPSYYQESSGGIFSWSPFDDEDENELAVGECVDEVLTSGLEHLTVRLLYDMGGQVVIVQRSRFLALFGGVKNQLEPEDCSPTRHPFKIETPILQCYHGYPLACSGTFKGVVVIILAAFPCGSSCYNAGT
jgi:hypothetical protein